jgi:hypothetical protein
MQEVREDAHAVRSGVQRRAEIMRSVRTDESAGTSLLLPCSEKGRRDETKEGYSDRLQQAQMTGETLNEVCARHLYAGGRGWFHISR